MPAIDEADGRRVRRWLRLAWKALVWLVVVAALLLVVGLAIVLVPVARDPSPRFAERKGELVAFRETRRWDDGRDMLSEMTLVSSSGLEVELTARIPREATGPRPGLVLL
ncbi:MAG TPA: hypothetical protein VD788_09000, partial [Candidatus Polarisedimenticolaceae bacterium]|nr:hypothetical protein [Candidatus Polarisedimenticolaceae bacterium]